MGRAAAGQPPQWTGASSSLTSTPSDHASRQMFVDRHIRFGPFDRPHVGPVDSRPIGQRLLRQPAPTSKPPQIFGDEPPPVSRPTTDFRVVPTRASLGIAWGLPARPLPERPCNGGTQRKGGEPK